MFAIVSPTIGVFTCQHVDAAFFKPAKTKGGNVALACGLSRGRLISFPRANYAAVQIRTEQNQQILVCRPSLTCIHAPRPSLPTLMRLFRVGGVRVLAFVFFGPSISVLRRRKTCPLCQVDTLRQTRRGERSNTRTDSGRCQGRGQQEVGASLVRDGETMFSLTKAACLS